MTARRQHEDGLCYYHARFGAKAKQCRKPCSNLVAMGAGHDCKLLFDTNTLSGRRLLIDSGAQRSILPAKPVDTIADGYGPRMDAANGTPISTYGTRYVEVCFSGRRFGWKFIIAVSTPLLGADFLCCYRLLVDVTNCRLIDALSFACIPARLEGWKPFACQTRLPRGTRINTCSPSFLTSPHPRFHRWWLSMAWSTISPLSAPQSTHNLGTSTLPSP